MKVRMEYISDMETSEIIIRVKEETREIEKLRQEIMNLINKKTNLIFYKDGKEFYFPLSQILFFETESNVVYAHTTNEVYQVKYRLYELEELLPSEFMRVSKSTILNINQIFSVDRTFASFNLVQFYKSHKQVYVSRMYYTNLKNRLREGRNL